MSANFSTDAPQGQTRRLPPPMFEGPGPLARWSLIILWVLSVLVAIVSFRFLVLALDLVMPHMVHHAETRPLFLYGHIALAPLSLMVLPIQFSKRLRARWPAMHRWTGRLYAVCVLLAGISAIALAMGAQGGPVVATGFATLAILWLGTTAMAVIYAMQGRIAAHRVWMIRSAALTLAATTLRLYMAVGVPFFGAELAYLWISWLCWVPNICIAEWLIRRRQLPMMQPA